MVLAANRDEFYARPALAAHWWNDAPNIYGGRDRQARGTWLAVSRDGRLAAVTNWTARDRPAGAESRGALPRAFLDGSSPPRAFAQAIDGGAYSGFNFVAYDGEELAYASNRTGEVRTLPPGVYGLTNTRLGGAVAEDASDRLAADEWPKATLGARALRDLAASATVDDLLALLARPLAPKDAAGQRPCEANPAHGETSERRESPAFLRGAEYGTRASTAVIFERDAVLFRERQYGPFGKPGRYSSATIALTPKPAP